MERIRLLQEKFYKSSEVRDSHGEARGNKVEPEKKTGSPIV
ncbi:hypothetical protein PAGL106935_05505 [Paenibacillus glucanolyticus]|jgi:hypothetical protein